ARVNLDQQVELLKRGASLIVPENGLRAKLEKSAKTGKPLVVKLGLDPTSPDIHLGFAVVLRKIRQFQDLGHRVTIIIGDYTTLIGDPSGRSATRPMLTEEQIRENAATYVDQLSVILDRSKTDIRFNSEWLGKLSFADLVKLTSRMTVAQVLTREDFRKRWDAGAPISLHELLYPLAQGYDSVAIEADIEMGGQDQTFNILTGRDLQAEVGQDQQIGYFMPLLVGLDGQKKMSKSLGNYVGIAEPAIDQYSKVMSLADELMADWFLLCTDVSVEAYSEWLSPGSNPMEAKHKLAHAIVEIYHGTDAANAASEQWKKVHSGRQFPDDAPEHTVSSNPIAPVALLVELGVCASNGDARRLVEQGGLSINGEKHTDTKVLVDVTSGDQLKAGKKHYFVLRTA
ncbi:MAG: tyrosine--tRNA ligase, partial [Armatimonadota bacterium]